MEVEQAISQKDPDTTKIASSEQTHDAVDRLINESKTEMQGDGKENEIGGKALEGKEDAKSEPAESNQDQPSKNVREGQRWNNRPRYNDGKKSYKPYKNNNKSNLVSEVESSDPVAIRKQVEFYFSESNLLQDKFLFTRIEGHENRPVPISLIHSFKRMRHFQPVSAVVDALKESSVVDIVDDDTAIQRKSPLPVGLIGKPMIEIQKVHESQSMARSVYAKGFGEEKPSTQFDIEAFFAQYGSTNSVRLRRAYDSSFKGSVFVEFDSEETQQNFLTLDPKPKWNGEELQIKSKKQYCDEKVDDIAAGKVRPNEEDRAHFKKNRDDKGGGDHEDGGRDWRVRREEDRKSGFQDRQGKRKGFGSSGRGRGGRGGGKHDRNRSRDRKEEKRQQSEHEIPEIRNSTPSDDNAEPQSAAPVESFEKVTATSNGTTVADTHTSPQTTVSAPTADLETAPSTKKRAREDEGDGAEEIAVKKVDIKAGES